MREKEQVTRVIFVRHGETDFPFDRIYCDLREDPPLNENGQRCAEQAAEVLAGVNVAAVYASPCLRTRSTAGLIAAKHGLEVRVEEGLRERHFGVWEGLYFHEIEERFPAEYREWKSNQAAFKPEGGESVYEMLDRVRSPLESVIERFIGNTVVVVSHVGPIRSVVCEAMKMPLAEYRRFNIEPASLTCVDYGKSQNNLICLNFYQGRLPF